VIKKLPITIPKLKMENLQVPERCRLRTSSSTDKLFSDIDSLHPNGTLKMTSLKCSSSSEALVDLDNSSPVSTTIIESVFNQSKPHSDLMRISAKKPSRDPQQEIEREDEELGLHLSMKFKSLSDTKKLVDDKAQRNTNTSIQAGIWEENPPLLHVFDLAQDEIYVHMLVHHYSQFQGNYNSHLLRKNRRSLSTSGLLRLPEVYQGEKTGDNTPIDTHPIPETSQNEPHGCCDLHGCCCIIL